MKERDEFLVIGKDYPKVEVEEKVTGEYEFVGDISLPHMLHAKILRSPYAHALVKSINTKRAKELPGVKAVITHEDVKERWFTRAPGTHSSNPRTLDTRIIDEKMRYVGDRVAAVAATSLEIAEEALELIEVEYEELPAVFDPVEAMQPGAPVVHESIKMADNDIPIKNNIVGPTYMTMGDVEEGFKQADLVVENEFRSGYVHNMCLGRPVCICRPLPGGGLEVWNQTQGIHVARMCFAASLGIPISKIKVHRVSLGGAFGHYTYLKYCDIIGAFLAMKTGQTVRIEQSREEMFFDGGRHPFVMKLKVGAKKDGTLTAMDMRAVDGVGAYVSGTSICKLSCGFFMSMYNCPNKRFDGRTVYTNTPPLGSMRGAGNPQQNFAVEQTIDIIAEKLNLDPVEIRLKNHLGVGHTFYGQGPDVYCTVQSDGTEQLVREGAKRIGWEHRTTITPYKDKPWIKRGIGMARGFHTSGASSTAGEKASRLILDYSGAIVKMNEDGTADLNIAAADMGTGNLTAMAAIAAEELGTRYEDVIVTKADTDATLWEYWIHASRSTYSVGTVVKRASSNAKKTILEWASRMLSVPADQLETRDSRIYSKAIPSKELSFREVLEYAQSQNWGTAIGTASGSAPACPPHFTVTFAEVEVDTMTGEVKVVRAVHSADVGTPIIPSAVRGQLIGGLHMGIGFALTEGVVYDPVDGHVVNPNFRDYKLVTPLDMPKVETFLADIWEPTGPFGAKGIGEGCLNPVAAAIYNAVYSAIGVRIYTMPITPEKILEALKRKQE
ncbi:MAG: xanthine dehydrogenase family protein molybdopterin-binding subunit, partial [Dehalococcoidia bacterium]|nr:xanthine dehydrogenase family protein molybdopterin-binding subunit [Dehalococcoidia bacterium]